ncbi:MAG: acyltransferase [Thermoanaerobaculia bacterium]
MTAHDGARERAIPYVAQLDGLRAAAVVAVIGSHYDWTAPWFWWGGMGVELFFVLSGFLITRILLKARSSIEEGSQTVGLAAVRFYIRRFLRIFPVYYLTLAVVAVVGIAPFRETLWWHVTYLSNVYFALRGEWYGPISHLWSLAVEEQFYLIWPWVILLTPMRWMRRAILLSVILGPASRAILMVAGAPTIAIETLVFTTFDLLGLGSLLAFESSDWSDEKQRRFMRLVWVGLIAAAALMFAPDWFPPAPDLLFGRLARGLVFGGLVLRAWQGFGGVRGALLSWRPVAYIGKISYAIYLFHTFAAELTAKVFHYAFATTLPSGAKAQALIGITATVTAAAVSWRYFEGPLNQFKEKFHAAR